MNIEQAKSIPIEAFFRTLGIAPEREFGPQKYYPLPGRRQHSASLSVNTEINKWFDHATGEKGDIVDLVCYLDGCDKSEALKRIEQATRHRNFFLSTGNLPSTFPSTGNTQKSRLEITKIQGVQSRALIDYIRERNIEHSIAARYLKEAYFKVAGRQYYALAFKNDKGGYELRNAAYKQSSSPKHWTTVAGRIKSTLAIFEGFMDFLSALTYLKLSKPPNDTIVLNSLAYLDKIEDKIREYEIINLFLDNDPAGIEAAKKVRTYHTNAFNLSEMIHPDHKDFNEFICSTKKNQDHAK